MIPEISFEFYDSGPEEYAIISWDWVDLFERDSVVIGNSLTDIGVQSSFTEIATQMTDLSNFEPWENLIDTSDLEDYEDFACFWSGVRCRIDTATESVSLEALVFQSNDLFDDVVLSSAASLSNIEMIDMSYTGLSSLTFNGTDWSSVTALNVEGNSLTDLPNDLPTVVPNLEHIFAADNYIDEIGDLPTNLKVRSYSLFLMF